MTTIVELPDEPRFTIKSVSSQTGIRPVTLRAWERRHEILNPYRSDNHYRLYSERDVAILRWLKHRLDEGLSIGSAVNELRGMVHNSKWPEAIPLMPNPSQTGGALPSGNDATLLFQALIKHDENRAGDLLREIHASYDILTICREFLMPVIEQIDEAWYQGRISIEIKRFTNGYLREKMLSLLCAYPSRHNAPLILVGCAPMEVSELSTLMMAVLLRSEGYKVEYLGPDIAIEDLADYASYMLPAMVLLTANSSFTAYEMRRMQGLLYKTRSSPIFAYAGQAFQASSELRREIAGVYLGSSHETALETVRYQLKARKKLSR